MDNKDINPINSHSIFSGIIKTKKNATKLLSNQIKENSFIRMDISHLTQRKAMSRESLSTIYYTGLIDSRYPTEQQQRKHSIYKHLSHFRQFINKDIPFVINNTTLASIHVEHIDYRVFSPETIIFSICIDNKKKVLDDITLQNSIISRVSFYNKSPKYQLSEEFLNLFQNLFTLTDTKNEYSIDNLTHKLFQGNKLYNYLLVQVEDNVENFDDLLYELSCNTNIGMLQDSNNFLYPDSNFKNQLMANNSIACYNNWKGLVLTDTTCILMKKSVGEDRYFDGKCLYFEFLYMNVFYLKAYLVMLNKKYQSENLTKKLKAEYLAFERAFNFHNISYNFLPQLIYDRLRFGMEINDELQQLKDKINLFNEKIERDSDKWLNIIVLFLTLISVISGINDFFELQNKFDWWACTPIPFLILIFILMIKRIK